MVVRVYGPRTVAVNRRRPFWPHRRRPVVQPSSPSGTAIEVLTLVLGEVKGGIDRPHISPGDVVGSLNVGNRFSQESIAGAVVAEVLFLESEGSIKNTYTIEKEGLVGLPGSLSFPGELLSGLRNLDEVIVEGRGSTKQPVNALAENLGTVKSTGSGLADTLQAPNRPSMAAPGELLGSPESPDRLPAESSGANDLVLMDSGLPIESLAVPEVSDKAVGESIAMPGAAHGAAPGESLSSALAHSLQQPETTTAQAANERMTVEWLENVRSIGNSDLIETLSKLAASEKGWVETVGTGSQTKVSAPGESTVSMESANLPPSESSGSSTAWERIPIEEVGGPQQAIMAAAALAIEALGSSLQQDRLPIETSGTSNAVLTDSALWVEILERLVMDAKVYWESLPGPPAVNDTRRMRVARTRRTLEVEE